MPVSSNTSNWICDVTAGSILCSVALFNDYSDKDLEPYLTGSILKLGEIAKEVYTLEIKKILAEKSGKLLKKLGYKNIHVKFGDGYFGWNDRPNLASSTLIILLTEAHNVNPMLSQSRTYRGRWVCLPC